MQFEEPRDRYFSGSSYLDDRQRSHFRSCPMPIDDIKTRDAYNRYSLQLPARHRPDSYHPKSYEMENSHYSLSHYRQEYTRSSSNYNINESCNSDVTLTKFPNRYSTDDLTPLHKDARSSNKSSKSNSRTRSCHDVYHKKKKTHRDKHHSKMNARSYSDIETTSYDRHFKEEDFTGNYYYDNNSDNCLDDDVFSDASNSEGKTFSGKQHYSTSLSNEERYDESPLSEGVPYKYGSFNYEFQNAALEYFAQEERCCIKDKFNSIKTKIRKASKNVHLKPPSTQNCSQILATMVVSIGPLCAGLGKGYSSPALASMVDLSAQGYHFSISMDQGSWVASLSLLGAFFGSLPAGFAIRYGRKRVLCAVAIPFALSWVLTFLSINVYMLYTAALIGGACTAVISVVTPVYISEIAHPDIRGCLCSFSKLTGNIGMLISYLLGAFLNWRQLATATAIAPVCLFIATLFIPETPSFLIYRGRDKQATESLKWLRGSDRDVSKEMTTIKTNIASMRRKNIQKNPVEESKELFRPLFITCGLMVFQKFSGANAFNFYAVPILSETFVGLNPYRTAIVVAFVQICAGMASSALLDTVGRRPLLVFSNMLMSVALAALGVYVYLKGLDKKESYFEEHEWRESDWVPLFCILVIEIAYAIGVSPISWLYIGEIFPLKHRGYGALAASVSYACSFASVKTFVDFQSWIGLYGAFWFYSSVAALALVFTLLYVPETKGQSLPEMQMREPTKDILI